MQYSAGGFGVPKLGTSWSFDLSIDIKPYSVAATNKIQTQTIVAGYGESAIRVLFKSKNCNKFGLTNLEDWLTNPTSK